MTQTVTPTAIRAAEWLYGVFMFLLPREMLVRHGRDVAETFRDAAFDAHERGGGPAVFLVCLHGLLGLAVAAVRERFRGHADTSAAQSTGLLRRVWSHVSQDAVFAVRSYRRNPGFALTAIGIVALGIGATTTIFSVVDAVVLRPLPYPDPDRIVYVDNSSHPPTAFRDWQDGMRSLDGWSAAWDMGLDLTGSGRPERLSAAAVTRDFFRTFGAQPALGRLFVAGDYGGAPQVAIISHGLWQRRFGGDPDVLGRSMMLGGHDITGGRGSFAIVGVLDARFREPETVVRKGTDVWLPLDETRADLQQDGLYALEVVGRLPDGMTLETAQAELNALVANLVEENPERYGGLRGEGVRSFPLVPLHQAIVADVDDALLMLLGAVGLLLLIACANVANLFLARGTDRAREMALRTALGAGRGRLIGQLLTESVVLALAGALLGVGLAVGGVRVLEGLNPGQLPRADAIAVNLRVLVFAVTVAVGTGVLFGVAPALRSSRSDAGEAIRDGAGGGTITAGRSGNGLRNALVVVEIALALMLAAGAGLLINSFVRLKQVDPGFRTEQLITIPIVFGREVTEAQRGSYAEQLLERVGGVPGVNGVTGGVLVPYQFYGGSRCCRMWGSLTTAEGTSLENDFILVHPVSAGYFTLLGARLRGRDFTTGDRGVKPAPVVISETLAAKMFGEGDALGRVVTGNESEFRVVGVVSDFRQWGLDQEASTEMFVPYAPFVGGARNYNLLVRTERPLEAIGEALRAAVWDVLPAMPVDGLYAMRQRIGESMRGPRFYSVLLAVFGAVALLLAAGGVYGSMLYSVGRRSRELGVRMALGATRSGVTGMILRQGSVLVVLGTVVGLAGAVVLGRVLDSLVFGITTTDLPTLVGVAVCLVVVAVGSLYLPARRAARSDPMEVLRTL